MIALNWQKCNVFTNNSKNLSVVITIIINNLKTGLCLFNIINVNKIYSLSLYLINYHLHAVI